MMVLRPEDGACMFALLEAHRGSGKQQESRRANRPATPLSSFDPMPAPNPSQAAATISWADVRRKQFGRPRFHEAGRLLALCRQSLERRPRDADFIAGRSRLDHRLFPMDQAAQIV